MAKAKKPKKQFKNTIIAVVLVFLLGFIALLAYSAYLFQNAPQEEEGFFVCNDEKTECRLSQHIHADISVSVCGDDFTFPRETGRTDEMHTHKERNYMHWHSPIKVDPVTRDVLPEDRNRVTVQAFLDQMQFKFPGACPNNQNPQMVFRVNEEIREEGTAYIWKDGDDIVIVYE